MSNLLQVCIYNTEPEAAKGLRTHISALNFVRVVADVSSPDALAVSLDDSGINLCFFHLDPDPDEVVRVIDQVSTKYPEVALIAISHQSDPQAILAPMRAGCDQFVCEPIDPTDLANAVARVASRRLSSSTRSRCICIVGPSGGSGTTSIACNLALEIGNLVDRECALVDLDLQFGDVASNFDAEPRYNISDLAEAAGQIDRTLLMSTLMSLPCKVAILSRPEVLEQEAAVTPDVIHHVVDLLKTIYENVVIDLPSRLDQRTIATLAQADLVIVVCQLLVPSLRNAKRYHDALQRMGVPDDRIEFIINRSEGRTGRLTVKDLEEITKKPVFGCIPNDYQFVARSIDFGRPIAALDRNSPVRTAIREIAGKIVSNDPTNVKDSGGRRSFLSRILSK